MGSYDSFRNAWINKVSVSPWARRVSRAPVYKFGIYIWKAYDVLKLKINVNTENISKGACSVSDIRYAQNVAHIRYSNTFFLLCF